MYQMKRFIDMEQSRLSIFSFINLVCVQSVIQLMNTPFITFVGGPLATAGHRKYSGILEKIRVASLIRSAFSVSIFGQKIRHNSTIQWQVQFTCLTLFDMGFF